MEGIDYMLGKLPIEREIRADDLRTEFPFQELFTKLDGNESSRETFTLAAVALSELLRSLLAWRNGSPPRSITTNMFTRAGVRALAIAYACNPRIFGSEERTRQILSSLKTHERHFRTTVRAVNAILRKKT